MKAAALLFLLVVLGFTAWQRQHFLAELRPGLLGDAMEQLNAAGYAVSVSAPAGMDAELAGTVPEQDDREAARKLVDGIRGLRAKPEYNRLRIPGRIRLHLEPKSSKLLLSGRLGDVEAGRRLVVALQEIATVDAVDVNGLAFEPKVADLSYLDSAAFLTLARVFFEIPGNGELVATEAGISMKGAGTVQARAIWANVEAELAPAVNASVAAAAARMDWDSALPAAGAYDRFRVHADVTDHPSPLHLPDYAPEAPIREERLRSLGSILERSEIVFAPDSVTAGADQTGKLEAAARAMQAAGERVRYAVGGHFQAAAGNPEPSTRLARERAEHVIQRLESLGIPSNRMDATVFPSPEGSGPPEAPRFRKVEIRVR